MRAKIIMVFGEDEYEYGIYPFNANEQKNKVNSLAETVKMNVIAMFI